jgi:hypothetical protein
MRELDPARVGAAREEDPNAFEAWTPEERQQVKRLYARGMSIEGLSDYTGRSRGAIRAHLVRHGVLEPNTKLERSLRSNRRRRNKTVTRRR